MTNCLYCGKPLENNKWFCNPIHRFKYEIRLKVWGL